MNVARWDRWARWGLGFFAAIYYLSVHRYGINVLDEGYLLGPVQRVLDGQVPYRDFVHQYAPGRFYIVAALLSIFPDALETTRVLWALLLTGSVVGLYGVARRVSGPLAALWAPLCLLAAPGPWQKSPLVACTVVSLWSLGLFARRPGLRTSALVGVVAGVICLVRQDVGIYALVSFVLLSGAILNSAGRAWARSVALCFLGCAAVLLPAVVMFAVAGAAGAALEQVLFAGLEGLRANSLPFPSIFPLLPRDLADLVEIPSRWIHYVPPVVYVVSVPTVFRGIRSGDPRARQALPILVMGVLLFRLDVNRSHILHLVQVIPPAWILVSWHWSRRWSGRSIRPALAVGVAAVAAGLLLLQVKLDHFHYPNSVLVASGYHETTTLERAHVRVAPRRRQALEGVVAELRRDTAPGEPILALPDLPLFHFLANRPNPIPFELLRPGRLEDVRDEDALLARIDEAGVRRMVWNARPVDG